MGRGRKLKKKINMNIVLILVPILYICFNGLTNFLCHQHSVKYNTTYDHQYARSNLSSPFKIVGNSFPFNKYAFLTARDSFATRGSTFSGIKGSGYWFIMGKTNMSVTEQLNSGVRALILKASDNRRIGEVRVGQKSSENIRYLSGWWETDGAALDILKEVEEFLSSNPFEILTLILEDCVKASNALSKVFEAANLTKYMLPLKKMPRHGGDWPLVEDMVSTNQRLIVFTSNISKEETEGIAYTWNFMVECKYGSDQYIRPPCIKGENLSAATDDTSKSLVLLNYYLLPSDTKDLMTAINKCYAIASNRWANFIAIRYNEEFGATQATYLVDFLNGKLLCGSDDVNSCKAMNIVEITLRLQVVMGIVPMIVCRGGK
ncbi:hypothetical protein RHMOL_Rhmol07G0318000 [Rhododendron molle]|uniref:Uncharacterized protein n=1 Tax=Rhododendron molle TaxID=49168 RepID=A0ACC0N756_RHOML|nr:hypothetical protein RHMOL_Rhmol07G0318000 [Rhododendron molle]